MTVPLEKRRSGTRVPPANQEAEESVLGAMMLSSDAANVVIERLQAEDFYKPAHQLIYEAILELYNANQPVDAITVSDTLRRKERIEQVGGVSYLTELLDSVPATSNADYYAGIIEEHALRRRLVRAGTVIGELAFDTDQDLADVLDQAEQTVFAVAEKRVGEGLMPVRPLLTTALESIEEMGAQGSEITGLSTGFRDLDRKLGGLHPSNLVIVAARPSMGKCLAGSTRVVDPKTGAMTTLEALASSRPVAIETLHCLSFDRETGSLVPCAPIAIHDNGLRPTFRLRTRLGREIVATANHPLLTIRGWKRLDEIEKGEAIAVPRQIDAFGVDRLADAEVALLGYLLGDGNLTGTTPRLTIGSDEILADVRRCASELGLELCVSGPKKSAPTYRLSWNGRVSQRMIAEQLGLSSAAVSLALADDERISSRTKAAVNEAAEELGYAGPTRDNPLTVRLRAHGLMGLSAHEKFVPDAVFRLPRDQVALFLSRLYAADGSAWTSDELYRIEYCTISEQLAKDVQHLLLRFGIPAKRRKRQIKYQGSRRTAYDVSFQDPVSVRRFADQIGIFSKEDQVARVAKVASARTVRKSASNQLPIETWALINEARGGRSWASISEELGQARNTHWHQNRRPSRTKVAHLARVLHSQVLSALANPDVLWDPVIAVELAGVQRTYDLTVPIHENFVADDIVVHNSALALNIAQSAAAQDVPVAIFSLEMTRQELVQRMLCSLGRVDSQKLRTGQLGQQHWQKIVRAAAQLFEVPIYLDDSPYITATEIRAKCRRLKRQHDLGLVVVDYLQLMESHARTENRQQEIAEISRALKNLARELEVPIVAVSQLNRALESRQDKHPMLGDLRESGQIEQDADVVMFIYRDEYYHPENQEAKGLAEVDIAKHRNGATGRVQMTFLAEFTLFADLGRDVAA